MINVNLSGDALVHCLKISGAKVVLVDGDEKTRERIEAVREKIEGLGIRTVALGSEEKEKIESGEEVEMVEETLRRSVKATDPVALFYTRSVLSRVTFLCFGVRY